MKLNRLNKADGSLERLEKAWEDECSPFGEDFEAYSQASLATLRNECDDGAIDPSTGVFGLEDEGGRIHAACFLNSTALKGYSRKVLRVRHFVLSPYYDFEDLSLDKYAEILADFFTALVNISDGELPSPHIKMHYRSPYDRSFFAAFGLHFRTSGRFTTVETKGMWLHLTK